MESDFGPQPFIFCNNFADRKQRVAKSKGEEQGSGDEQTPDAGEPDFEAVEPTKAADGLIEFSGNSVESARNIADAQVAQAKAELDELAKKAPMKGKVKLSGSPIAMIKQQKQADEIYKQQKAEHDQQLEAAQKRYTHWQSIQNDIKTRQESTRHEQALAEDAERKRKKAELKAEQERADKWQRISAEFIDRQRRKEAREEEERKRRNAELQAEAEQKVAEQQQPAVAETEPAKQEETPQTEEPNADTIAEEEEEALRKRITETDEEWTEPSANGDIYKQKLLIDGKEVIKVDAPDESKNYPGTYYEVDGKQFGDLQEVVRHLDGAEQPLSAKIKTASADVNTEPTEAQKEAGNYKKGHVQVGTFDITIEQPEGSVRKGTDANGKQWESKMHNTYGYFRGTEGVDGDHIDVFLSNDIDGWNGRKVYVVDQYNPDGTFDEHKVMLGFNDMDEAKSDYLANYEKGWEDGRRIDVSATNLEDFEKWIDSSHRKTKPFAEYAGVKKETVANAPAKEEMVADVAEHDRLGKEATGANNAGADDIGTGSEVKTFNYFTGSLSDLISQAKTAAKGLIKKVIAPISDRLKNEMSKLGIDIAGYNHVIDNNAIRHILKQHSGEKEIKRGQLSITDEDFERIEDVVENYDDVKVEKGKRNELNLIYSKSYSDGTTIFVEEKRDGRKELAAVTMWKIKSSTPSDANRKETTPISDSSETHSDSKVTEKAVENKASDKKITAGEKRAELQAEYDRLGEEVAKAREDFETDKAERLEKEQEDIKKKLDRLSRYKDDEVVNEDSKAAQELDRLNEEKTRIGKELIKAIDDNDREAESRLSKEKLAIDEKKREVVSKLSDEELSEIKYYDEANEEIKRREEKKADDEFIEKSAAAQGDDVRVKPKNKKTTIQSFCAGKKEPVRPQMYGVYHSPDGEAVSTDAYVLVVSKSAYDKSKKGKIVDKDGKEIIGKYPDYRKVLPKENSPVKVDYDDMLSFVSGAIARYEAADKGNKRPPENAQVVLRLPDGRRVVINAYILEKFIRGAKMTGADNIDMVDLQRPITARGKDGTVICVPAKLRRVEGKPGEEVFVYDVKGKGGDGIKEHRGEEATAVSEEDAAMRDVLVDKMKSSGIDVVTDSDEGQKILDMANDARLSKDKKRALETVSVTSDEAHQPTVVSNAKDMKITDHVKFFRTKKGQVYGFTMGDKIYLDKNIAGTETAVHEYTHLWGTAFRNTNAKEWKNIVGLMKDTPLWEEVKKKYPELEDENDLAEEVLAHFSGRRGAERLRKAQEEANKEGLFGKASALSAIAKVREALNKFWKGVCDMLHVHFTSAEEVADAVLNDLLNGVNPGNVNKGKSLAGVHNISEEKLAKAIKQGGLANPSVAVIDTSHQKHEDFGEISLIMPSDKIAKRSGRNADTFYGDAWTPTYPKTDKRLPEQGKKKFAEDLNKLPKEMQNVLADAFEKYVEYGDDRGMGFIFLSETGRNPEVTNFERKYSQETVDAVAEIMKGRTDLSELSEAEIKALEKVYAETKYGSEEGYRKYVEEHIASMEKFAEERPNSSFTRKSAPKLQELKEKGYLSSELEAFARGVKKASETPDEANTEKAKKDAMARIESEGLENEYKEWLKKKEEEYGVDEVIFDGYTDSGRRRYLPNTVENASKVMKQQGRAASENVAPTFHTFVASVLESSGKLDDLRKNKKKLTSEHEDVTAFKEEWGKTYHELAKALNPNPERIFNDEGYFRLSEVANSKDPKAFAKKEYGVELTDEEVSKLHSLVEAIRTERPAMYFETKFERPVTLDEFSAAVVPNTLSPEVRKGLEASGIKLFEYDPAKENDRKRAFDEASSGEGIRFQFVGEKGAENADKLEEADRRMDNLRVAREMEKSEKDAKSIKIATGWERGADGKWRYEIPDVKYHPEGDAEYEKIRNRQRWSKELDELSDKVFEGKKLSDKEEKQFDELVQLESEFKADYLSQEKPYLTNWVENDELFASYPELKQTQIIFTDQLPERTAGYYSEKDNTIVVNTKSSLAYESIIAHEVQHAIQRIEGFARGGSIEEIEKDFQRAKEEVRARSWAFQLKETAKELGGDYNQLEVEKALIKEYEDMNMSDMMPDEETRIKGFNYFARGYADRSLDDAIKRYKLDTSTGSNFNSYKEYQKLAGEVESRNVQERMYMTSEERRKSLAAETEDVSREDQIFLYGETGINEIVSPAEMDESAKAERGNRLMNAPAVDVKSKQIVKKDGTTARQAAEKWWKENIGNSLFYDTEIGKVEINEKSIGTSLAHRYGQPKLDAITSLKEGFGNAVYLGSLPDFVRQVGVLNHYFAYPINYDGKRCYVFCRAMQDANKNRLYVHEVFVADNIQNEGNTLQTAAFQPHGGIALYKSILSDILSAANLGRNTESAKNSEGNLHYRMGDSTQTFAERQRKAVENRGTVMPGLNEAEVRVVEVPKHSYKGTIKEATERAIESAKAKYVPNGEPKILHYNNYGTSFDYEISKTAIQICLSPTHQSKSVNKGSHLALADHLDEIINNSIEVEEHPDYTKDENGLRGNGINSNALMHRFYGAVTIDGKQYRVMTLMRENQNSEENNGSVEI